MVRGRPENPGQRAQTFAPWGSVPQPDPTVLTTEAVARAQDQWRRELASLREVFETRITAIDEATRLHQKATDELPEMLERR